MKKLLFICGVLVVGSLACGKVDQKQSSAPPSQTATSMPSPPVGPALSRGALKFGPIPQLPKNWWQDGAEKAFEVWDKNTLYLWGANPSNYLNQGPQQSLRGSGMAGATGPSRGYGHPNYVGVITTSVSKALNDAVFAKLNQEQERGKNIWVPVSKQGRWALGTGIAFSTWFKSNARDWKNSQYYLLEHIYALALGASAIDWGTNTFWPDCSMVSDCEKVGAGDPASLSLNNIKDLERIKNYALSMRKNELVGWKFRKDDLVKSAPEQFFGFTQLGPEKDTKFTAFTLVLLKKDDGSFLVLTQKRADDQTIEAPGGHLKGGQTWREGARDELKEEAGIALATKAFIYLQGGNDLSKRGQKKINANFLVVFAGIRPDTSSKDPGIDPSYGHQWLNLKKVFKEVSDEETSLGWQKSGKYFRFFRGHVINFCENVVKNLGVCE